MQLSSHFRRKTKRHDEQGYILLTLLLTVALMTIVVAFGVLPNLKFNLRRDQEQEMIHRGVQYSNAIRRYYKKFGRYPTKIEDLENTSNVRFLRKRYTDPMNCKAGKCQDFKLLYFSDVQAVLTGFGGGGIAGATSVSAMSGGNPSGGLGQSSLGQSSFGQSSSFGQGSSFGQSSSFGGGSSFGGSSSFGSSNSSFGGNSNSSFGQSQNQGQNQPGANNSNTDSPQPGDNSDTNASGANSGNSPSNGVAPGQVIGGPIVGVASATKIDLNTIREYNHKKKYKDWMFIYDPMQDQGRLITTPYQPQIQGVGQPVNLNGTNTANGTNGTNGNSSGFGSNSFGSSSFGSSNSFGNSSSGSQNGPGNSSSSGFGNSNQSSGSPQQ
jgi:type II secretory pathway pseudopilin PulG